MIKSLPKIKNVISFVEYSSNDHFFRLIRDRDSGQLLREVVEFGKTNIIFGDNGCGKTALVRIFRKLNGEDLLLERNWQHENDDQQIEINTVLGEVTCEEQQCADSLKEKFRIFDRDFVANKVHVIGKREAAHNQQTGAMLIQIGQFYEITAFLDFVSNLRRAVSDRNNEIKNDAEELLEGLCRNYSIETALFVRHVRAITHATVKLEDVESNISRLKTQITKLERASNQIDKIQKIEELEVIQPLAESYSEIGHRLREALQFSLEENIRQAQLSIADKVAFIQRGVEILHETKVDVCPFCGQKIVDKEGHYLEMVQQYIQLFNKEFELKLHGHELEIKELETLVINLDEFEAVLLKLDRENRDKSTELAKYSTKDLEYPTIPSLNDRKNQMVKDIRAKVEQKMKEPFSTIDLDDTSIQQLKELVETLDVQLRQYNDKINELNQEIQHLKRQDKTSIEHVLSAKRYKLAVQQCLLLYLKNKQKIDNQYIQALAAYEKNRKVIVTLENIGRIAEDKIETSFQDFTSEYFEQINKYIYRIDPSMVLDIQGKGTYDKRHIKSTIATFEVRTKDERKVDLCCLSEGEKQTISLCYFLAQLEKEDDNVIIVLDDPITSFDAAKRKAVAEMLRDSTQRFSQMFILTCDPLFDKYCKSTLRNALRFWMLKNDYLTGGSFLFPVSAKNMLGEYKQDLVRLLANPPTSAGEMLTAGQKLRYCLELSLKDRILMHSASTVNEIIEKIGVSNEEITKFINDRDKLAVFNDIYRFCDLGGALHYDRCHVSSWTEMKFYIQKYLALGI